MRSSTPALYVAVGLVASLVSVNAQQGAWAQCGGTGWTGGTTCVAGWTCVYSNPWYSQCLQASSTPVKPSSTTTTTTTSSSKMTTSSSKSTSTIKPTSSSTTTYPSYNDMTIKPTSMATTTTTTTTTTTKPPTGTNTAAESTDSTVGKQIRTDQDPVYHLYLQDVNGSPQLGDVSTSGYFVYGTTVGLVMADGSKLYLNVDMSPSTSYKPLTLDTVAKTTNWAMSGDTFLVGSTQNFVVCPITGSSNWNLYLQTGNDMPSTACTDWITIHLPCLC